MKQNIVTGIDIGNSSIKIVSAVKKSKDGDIKVIGQVSGPVSGIRKGVIDNIEKASKSLYSALLILSEQLNAKIYSVYPSISGSHLFSLSSTGLVSVSRADGKISQEDIDRVVENAKTFPLASNKEIFYDSPKEFIVDGVHGIKEPLGLKGVRLEADVMFVGAFSPYLKNLTSTILNLDLDINDVIASSLASSRSVLTPRESELGVALLDIGAGNTDLAVLKEGRPLHLRVFPIGSANITNDIAIGLKTDIDIAERIKLDYGSCLPKTVKKKEKIKVDNGEGGILFSRKEVSEIIEARVSEIFEEVEKELKKIHCEGSLPSGIVLTGGGAKIPHIAELARKHFKLPVKVRAPLGFSGLDEDPVWSTACGLVLYGFDSEESEGEKGGFKGLEFLKKLFRVFVP